MKKKNFLLKFASKGMILMNCLAMVMAVNAVNVTCSWIWGQPETPDELKDKYRKF